MVDLVRWVGWDASGPGEWALMGHGSNQYNDGYLRGIIYQNTSKYLFTVLIIILYLVVILLVLLIH